MLRSEEGEVNSKINKIKFKDKLAVLEVHVLEINKIYS